jgi:aryl-alcohol dehydrogenase-like predicted oxidoreductase
MRARIGLGCMRLSPDDFERTVAAAVAAGVTLFDTAHAYDNANERLLARSLRQCGAASTARIVTKGGMGRPGGGWQPDGRAKTIRSDCVASLDALDGIPIELYLIHAPDPRTPWRTSVRALAKLVDEGLVSRAGVSNVNRAQLDEAVELAPIAAVQVALSVFDDRALRGGIVERCTELGIALLAHSPLGGPRRAPALARDETLTAIAETHVATPAQVALAWLLGLSPVVVAIPGARRPETATAAAHATDLLLTEQERALIGRRFGAPSTAARRARVAGEVVLVMGIPGAGKSRLAEDYVGRGYTRLNRDERGGSLRELADVLDDELARGARRLVVDNTYLTRAARSRPLEAAARHGLPVHCVWLDTPLAEAQVNIVLRLLRRFGGLPTPEELRRLSRQEQGVLAPTSQMRAQRELEPPSTDEGFAAIDHVRFTRTVRADGRGGVLVAAPVLGQAGWEDALLDVDADAPHLVFDWRPGAASDALDAARDRIAALVSGPVDAALCPHGGGPPICWCRPPLPGLPLAFAHRHRLDPQRSVLVGRSTAHRALATAVGARYVES